MEKSTEGKRKQRPPRQYCEHFKRLVVTDYEQGFLNKTQIKRKYDIRGKDCLDRWLRKYGKFTYPKYSSPGRPMKDKDKQHLKELEARFEIEKRELEEKLKQSESELVFYRHFIEVAERELNIKIVKKSGAKQFKSIYSKNKNKNSQ